MKKCFFFVLLVTRLQATELTCTEPDITATLLQEELLVGGVVSPLSGQVVLRELDLEIKGAQALHLTRFFVPHSLHANQPKRHPDTEKSDHFELWHLLASRYIGWRFFPEHAIRVYPSGIVRLMSSSGAILDYRVQKEQMHLLGELAGISNGSEGQVGAQYDLRNYRISLDGQIPTIITPDGIKLVYRPGRGPLSDRSYWYELDKAFLPNGKAIRYIYKEGALIAVEATSQDGTIVYGSIQLEHKDDTTLLKGSDGTEAVYTYKRDPVNISFNSKRQSGALNIDHGIKYLSSATSIKDPESSVSYTPLMLIDRYRHGDKNFRCSYYKSRENAFIQIKDLVLADGTSYHFVYDAPIASQKSGKTEVTRNDGTKIVYLFSKQLLPTSILFYDLSGLRGSKVFTYDEKQFLKKVAYLDPSGRELKSTSYNYDAYGNPVLEVLTGDLTGNGFASSYAIRRRFTPAHLVEYQEEDDGSSWSYTYHKQTHLPENILFKAGPFWIEDRYVYDEHCNLLSKTRESSDGKKERFRYGLYQTGKHIHRVKEVFHEYEEEGAFKLLSRKSFNYDTFGNRCEESVRDAEDHFVYLLESRYNARGDLIEQSNPLKQRASYRYDFQGRKLLETSFSKRIEKAFEYDLLGRVIKESATPDSGNLRASLYKYDADGQRSFEQDYLGAKKSITNDFMAKKPSKIIYPETEIKIVKHAQYDALGRKIVQIDANGEKTYYSYTARSDVASIKHPDGSCERFFYSQGGHLKEEINRDGIKIVYKRDALGKVIEKCWLAPSGSLLASEESLYDCEDLLMHKSRDGLVSHFEYDGARRMVRQIVGERVTTYTYDPLGRIATKFEENGAASCYTHYSYDLLDRCIKEEKRDEAGKLLWSISRVFDADGNKSKIVRGNGSTQCFEYDAFGRLICSYDPMGKKKVAEYNDHFINKQGQRVSQKKITTKTGKVTLETLNTHGLLASKECFGKNGEPLLAYSRSYDGEGNLISHIDETEEGPILRRYHYKGGHLVAITGAEGTPDSKSTFYSYTPSGQLEVKKLPDGSQISYKYDGLGYLKELTSGSVRQSFVHSKEGRLLEASDGSNHLKREVDLYGNILSEELSNGLKFEKRYDAFNRPVELKIDGYGTIRYQYDPLYMRTVSRFNESGKLEYTHCYESYDHSGLLTTQQQPFKFGRVTTGYDAMGRQTAIKSYYFNQELTYDLDDNLIASKLDKKLYRYSYNERDELVAEEGHHYQYKDIDNRLEKDGKICSHNLTHQLLEQGNLELTYDGRGNLSSKGTSHYKYDPLGRLIKADIDGKQIRYNHDVLDRVVAKQSPNGVELRLHDGMDEILIQSKNKSALRILGAGGKCVAIELDGKPYIPMLDVQGSIRTLLSPSGKVLSAQSYTAFGEGKAPLAPWGYLGKLYDADLGWYNFGKRYYDPELARFVTPDPAGFIDSSNPYQYVLNNPFKYVDPYGEFIMFIPLLAWGGTVSAIGTAAVYTAAIMTGAYLTQKTLEMIADNARHERSNAVFVLGHPMVSGDPDFDFVFSNKYIEKPSKVERGNGDIDHNLPEDIFNNPDWENITHPGGEKNGHYQFKDKKTGDILEYDKAKPGEPGHKAYDHFHRPNPNSKTKDSRYLDGKGNPVADGHNKSHLYPPGAPRPKK